MADQDPAPIVLPTGTRESIDLPTLAAEITALGDVGVASQGELTIAEPVTSTNTFTIATTVYKMMTTPAAAYDVAIGASEAATKVNIVAAINASGTPGTEYFAGTLIHPTVSAAAFVGDACVITAKATGVAANSYPTTETFTHASNVFDDTTMGTETAGVDDEIQSVSTPSPSQATELADAHMGLSGVVATVDTTDLADLTVANKSVPAMGYSGADPNPDASLIR